MMKKKAKILIGVIIAILFISSIGILAIYEWSQYYIYTVQITSIEDNRIIVEDYHNLIPYELYENVTDADNYYGHKVIKEDKVYVTQKYQLYLNNVVIKNKEGRKISISNLSIGDTINVIIKEGLKKDFLMYPQLLQNIKGIKVIENKTEESK